MRLTLSKLVIEGFGSFTRASTFDLSRYGPGLHLLTGENKVEPRLGANGAGKSTLLNSLMWCLFGKTSNGLRNPDIKPWKGKKGTTVSVHFWCDEIECVVTRTAHPNRLTLNGNDVDQSAVENLLGLSFEVVQQTILLGQGRPLFHDLPNREKLQLLSDVLGLDRWDEYSKRAAVQASRINASLAYLDQDQAKAEGMLETIRQQISRLKKDGAEWEKDRNSVAKNFDEQLAERKRLEREAANAVTAAEILWEGADTGWKNAQEARRNADKAYRAGADKKVKEEANIWQLNRAIIEIEKKLEYQHESHDTCPTCGQPWKKSKDHIKSLKVELKNFKTELSKIKVVKTEDLEQALFDANKREGIASENRGMYKDKLTEQRMELKHRQAEVKRMEDGIRAAKEVKNPFKAQLKESIAERKRIKEQLFDIEDQRRKYERRLERNKYWIKGFKDVRLYVLEEVLQELEFVTNDMLPHVGLVDWRMRFSIEKETKSGTLQRGLITVIESPNHKEPVKWESWSGGESQRLRLVGALALSQVLLDRAGVEVNIEILDEPTRHLSNEGVEDLCDFLAERAHMLDRQTWIVDHMTVPSAKFEDILTVVKTEKGSRLR